MTQSLSFTGGGESGGFVAPLEKIITLEKQIDGEVKELMSVRAEIESVVNKIRNPLYKMILWRKYIIGERFEAIAEKENYTFQYIKNAHSQALKVVDGILQSEVEVRSE